MTSPPPRKIRKVVIPAAGFGTRMLPVTKELPKEMMPICNKPIIQYAVEEAAASGIEEVILITRADKSMLEGYFAPAVELEDFLVRQNRLRELKLVRELSSLVRITTVRQAQPLGLGDAVRCARSAVGDETFAVILPDAVIDAPRPVLAQLVAAYQQHPGCFVATQPVDPAEMARFGMLAITPVPDDAFPETLFQVSAMVEKPRRGESPSAYGVFGRYLLRPEIFDFLDSTQPDTGGEIQLTDALAKYCRQSTLYALCFEGTHYNAGEKSGYLQAVVHFALKDPELGPELRRQLSALVVH
jgi:UTP--glucose-1-phosphate uridylyltransferase